MARELDALLRTKNLSRSVWQSMLRFFDGRVASLEASKNVDEAIRENVLARGLTVINDHIQPALDSSATKVAQIEALRVSANAIHAQLEEALEFGANTDLVTEGPGGLNRYFTPIREQALKDDLRGAGIAAARDTLKEISDALDAEIAAIKGGVGAQHDTLAEVSAAISALQTSLTIKSDVGHTHAITAVSGLQGQLDAKAAAGHTHQIADVIGLQAALLDPFSSRLLHVRDEKPVGTNGGGFTSGAWRTRTLNTVKTNEIAGASLSSNQITLPAGTYWVDARCPAHQVEGHKARLRNITSGVTLISGTNEKNLSANGFTTTHSYLKGRITVSEITTLTLEHRCEATGTFGVQFSMDEVEVYSEIMIWKLA